MIELLEDGVALLDANGAIVRANPAMARILAYPHAIDLAGVFLLRDLSAGPIPSDELIEVLYRTGEIRQVETELVRRDARRAVVILSVRAFPNADEWPAMYEAVCTDITDRTWLEGRWRRHQRLATAGSVAGGLMVDFRQLATAILGYHDLLTDVIDERHPRRADLSQIRETAERLAAMTLQLAQFTRPRVRHTAPVDVSATIADLAPTIRDTIGNEITLRTQSRAGAGSALIDPGEFTEVTLNLASAACEMAPGPVLTILTDTTYLDATFSREHTCISPGKYVSVVVSTKQASDESLAAPDWERERPFTADVLQGDNTTLGDAYAFTKQHGGHLTIRRDDPAGITFKMYLPPAIRAADLRTILIVEDEASVRHVARRVLEHLGYQVLEAADGHEALWLAARYSGQIDLLLADVVLPGMGAQELADRFLAARSATRVLFMSGLHKQTLVDRGILRSDAAFVSKPFTADEIAASLDGLLTAGS